MIGDENDCGGIGANPPDAAACAPSPMLRMVPSPVARGRTILILRSRPQVGVSKDAWFETRRYATLLTMRECVF